jgi:hypothetical protein
LIDPVIDVRTNLPFPDDPEIDEVNLNRAGSLVDFMWSGTIRRCYVQGGSISGDLNVGGLVAYNYRGTITDCYSAVNVGGIEGVAGLVGFNMGTVTGCHTNSDVVGEHVVGGLVGLNDGTIQNSSAMGSVMGDFSVGGLVGENGRYKTIQNSFSTGSVIGIQEVGGLVGTSHGDVTNCYSTSIVTGGRYVGGLVGFFTGLIVDCYSTGRIAHEPIEGFVGNPRISGLVGSGHEPFDVLRSFWDIETSGRTISFGGTGLTTAEMQTAGTFLEAGWDFVDETDNGADDVWWIDEGRDYPRLWWEPFD